MRAVVIGVVLLVLTLPFAPEAVNFDSLSGFALIVAWGVACGVVALGVELLVRSFTNRRDRSA
ncbi:hypothetical protein [Streptomyces sp. NPDC088727]|uniref:hypothetical protein n=1 Tax=Streptomyces sp. NPDC088727 TaxID=3365875 RepID=UPI00382E269B